MVAEGRGMWEVLDTKKNVAGAGYALSYGIYGGASSKSKGYLFRLQVYQV